MAMRRRIMVGPGHQPSSAFEFYLVKDLIEVQKLERSDEPSLYFDLKFPDLVKTVDQSKSGREFAGKLREVVKRDYDCHEAGLNLTLDRYNSEKLLTVKAHIIFNVLEDPDDSDYGEFHSIFGEIHRDRNLWISMTLSLCHLPTENTPVSPEDLFTLDGNMYYSYDKLDKYGFASYKKEVIEEMQKLWNHESGFIYTKLTVLVAVTEEAVKRVMEEKGENSNEIVDLNRKMLNEEICTDLEIICQYGKIVKCHKAVLGGRSKVFQAMFQAEEMEEARTGKLEMEEMSEEGVRAFLGWVYWKDEKEALLESDVAVELLIEGDKYDLGSLVETMKEIILERRGHDEGWFSVDSAVNLFGWARNVKGMEELKAKAVGLIKFFGKTSPEKLLESEEYQELIKNDVQAAMELTQEN